MDKLLDFNQPLDVPLLDSVVEQFYAMGSPELGGILVQFQAHPLAWTRVDTIFQHSRNPTTKLLALDVLNSLVKSRWNLLPAEQKDGIKNFLINLIIQLSKEQKDFLANRSLLQRLNLVLVQVVKQEWPHNWPSFIPDLVNSSRVSESLCANNMDILRLLSEEIFEHASEDMTSEKTKAMKKNLNREFTLIYQLCDYIFANSQNPTLLNVTLQTLQRFLNWIPVGYIFETNLIETLAVKFLSVSIFQNDTLLCLAEVGGLKLNEHPQYNPKFIQLFATVTKQVASVLTDQTDVARVYATGNPQAQTFVRNLTIFISSFLKSHLALLEQSGDATRQVLQISLTFLLRMSQVDDKEVFKICLECWSSIVADLFNTHKTMVQAPVLMLGQVARPVLSPRMQLYAPILSMLRTVMISKMAKPEEVIVVRDENTGDIVREQAKDTDAITLYKSMRECLIYLTNLDPQDTQDIMLLKLSKQVDGSEWSELHHPLNTLCWAIGSISGSLNEIQEKTFLVRVIKDLLHLCEMKRGRNHKAVIASNIMYVVGQYPRFLRMHWKFLRTVVNKLFEFMHEKHPGVQDMSCETFLKIAHRCKRKFVVQQQGETRPYIEQMLDDVLNIISDLDPQQIHIFYEAMAVIIFSQTEPERRQHLIVRLMSLPNQAWTGIITKANGSIETLWQNETIKQMITVLKTNNHVASALGPAYIIQLSRIFLEMLHVYKLYSGYISNEITKSGPGVTAHATIKYMRTVKAEILKLLSCFFQNSEAGAMDQVFKSFIPPLVEPVLDDYQRGVPDSRDAEVISLFTDILGKFGGLSLPLIPKLYECVFQATLDMIKLDFTAYPDHRLNFFKLIRVIINHAFRSLLALNAQQFQLFMESIAWCIKHLKYDVSEVGLNALLELLNHIQNSEVANHFFKTYLLTLIQDILGVLTDTFHKNGLNLQCQILQRLFQIVETGVVTIPLWGAEQQFPNNQTFVRGFVTNLIGKTFQTVTPQQVDAFVTGLFALQNDLPNFKIHVRDFLISLKFFQGAADIKDLYQDEANRLKAQRDAQEQVRLAAVPGLSMSAPTELAMGVDDMTDHSFSVPDL